MHMNRPQINYKATGRNIRLMRKELGFSAADMAKEMCIVEMAWYKYEQGKCLPGTYEDLYFMAGLLGTAVDRLVVFEDAS